MPGTAFPRASALRKTTHPRACSRRKSGATNCAIRVRRGPLFKPNLEPIPHRQRRTSIADIAGFAPSFNEAERSRGNMLTRVRQIRSRLTFGSFVLIALAALAIGQIGAVAASPSKAVGTAVANAEPIVIENLGSGMPSGTPGKAILLLRITLQSGAAFPAHIHPGALVIAVQSGDFAFTVLTGQADATRGVASGTPEATETLAAGQEVVFHAGDEIFEQEGVVHTARNSGADPAVVLVAALVDPTKPFLQPAMGDMAGTATPAS